MERCLSEIFGLETIGYKSITKLQSRQTGQAGLRFNSLLGGHATGVLGGRKNECKFLYK